MIPTSLPRSIPRSSRLEPSLSFGFPARQAAEENNEIQNPAMSTEKQSEDATAQTIQVVQQLQVGDTHNSLSPGVAPM